MSAVIVSAHPTPPNRIGAGVAAIEAHVVELAPGERFKIRPVRPDDEEGVTQLLNRLSLDEVRLRFFCCRRHFPHEFVERLTSLDNVNQLGLVAIPAKASSDEIVANAMLIPTPDGKSAEFAVLVHHDYTQHGLGRHLLDCLIEHARLRGVRQVFGLVLAENEKMLQLAREMGFRAQLDLDEPDCMRVELELTPA